MSNILMIVTGADSLTMKDGSQHPTGFWAEELVTAHRDLVAAGHTVTIATPGGVHSDRRPGQPRRRRSSAARRRSTTSTPTSRRSPTSSPRPCRSPTSTRPSYAAIVLPGGHGPMADLAFDAATGRVLVAANAAGTIIAPFCHGPAALLSAKLDDGSFAFAGRRLTVFTDEEERTGGTGENTPWWVGIGAARSRGASSTRPPRGATTSCVDGNLITGQNPQSSASVARRVLEALAA